MSENNPTLMRLEKFSGNPSEDFNMWRLKLLMLAASKGYGIKKYLLEDVTSSLIDDSKVPVETFEKDREKDDLAKSLVILHLSDEIIPTVLLHDSDSAFKVFSTLCAQQTRKSRICRTRATRFFWTTKMLPDESVTSYCARVQASAVKLRATGREVSQIDIVDCILSGLPEEYDNLLTNIDSADDNMLTISSITARLLDVELQHSNRFSCSGRNLEQANAATISELQSELSTLRAMLDKKTSLTCKIHGSGHTNARCYVQHPELAPAGWQTRSLKKTMANTVTSDFYSDASFTNDSLSHRDKSEWILDCGCSNSMSNSLNTMSDYKSTTGPSIALGDNRTIKAMGVGTAHINLEGFGPAQISNTMYVPNLGKNLWSIGQTTRKGFKMVFDGDRCDIYAKENFVRPKGTLLATVKRRDSDNLYPLHSLQSTSATSSQASLYAKTSTLKSVSASTWHDRTGHLNEKDLKILAKHGATGIQIAQGDTVRSPCEPCILAKMTRKPFAKSKRVTTRPGELIFSDIEGPFPVVGIGAFRYYVSYIDHHTRYAVVYLLQRKSQQLESFKLYEALVQAKFGERLGRLESFQSDNAGEYVSNDCNQYYKSKGITHRTIVPYDSESNGLPERFNRTLCELAETCRLQSGLPPQCWPWSITHGIYLLNRRPHSALSLKMTPFEAWNGTKPDLSHLITFGSDGWAYVAKCTRSKLQPRAVRVIFIGYETTQASYRLWHVEERKVFSSRSVSFNERSFTFHFPGRNSVATKDDQLSDSSRQIDVSTFAESDSPNKSNMDDEINLIDQDHSILEKENDVPEDVPSLDEEVNVHGETNVDATVSAPTETRHSTRIRAPILRLDLGDFRANSAITPMFSRKSLLRPSLVGVKVGDVPIPKNIEEALTGHYSGYWWDALHAEMLTHGTNGTFELSPLPTGFKPIKNKWVFDVKPADSSDGTIRKFKCRLVAKGFSQVPGRDFDDTFAPVAHITSIRLIIALAAQMGLELRQIDYVSAYLNGHMDKEVYMEQPDGFTVKNSEHLVCRLKKALYGTKQAGNLWNTELDTSLVTKLGFVRILADPCVYVLRESDNFLIMGIHVDDGLLAHNNGAWADDVIRRMNSEFTLVDQGFPSRLISVRVRLEPQTGDISLDQQEFANELLERFGMTDCKPASTPHQPGLYLTKEMCPQSEEDREIMRGTPFAELIGGLVWLMNISRPDICTAVGVLCRFTHNPGPAHWIAAKHILRYIKGTTAFGIRYRRGNSSPQAWVAHFRGHSPPEGWADADWAGDPDSRRSTLGEIFKFAGGPISWRSSREKGTAPSLSSTESEIKSLCAATRQATWLTQWFTDVGLPLVDPLQINEDNQGAISWSKNFRTEARSKHIEVKYHYTRYAIKHGTVAIKYCATSDMIADSLTKPVSTRKFLWCRDAMGVINVFNPSSC
jgi:hypothetical protein